MIHGLLMKTVYILLSNINTGKLQIYIYLQSEFSEIHQHLMIMWRPLVETLKTAPTLNYMY